jgi:hypothetical protein
MKFLLKSIIPLSLAAAVFVSPAWAQQEGTGTLLPDIDPQDIEIRGDFQARFPGLARQPVLGFSPEPALYRVDPDRMPFIESDEEVVATIPIGELEPALRPEQQFIDFVDRQRVFTRAGYGNMNSPELHFVSELPLGSVESLAMDLGFQSSDGDRDFSSFKDLTGKVQWTRQAGSHRFGLGIDGSASSNYSPIPGPTDQLVFGTDPIDLFNPLRLTHNSFGVEGRWQQLQHAYRGWQSAVTFRHFSNEGSYFDNEMHDAGENRYKIFINRFWEGTQLEQAFGVQARAAGSFYNTIEGTSQYWLNNSVGTRYRQVFGLVHEVEAWLRFYQLYDPVHEFDLYLYPDIHYQYAGMGRFTGSVRVRGFVDNPSLEDFHSVNRFVLQHGGELEQERGLQIHLNAGLRLWDNSQIYTGLNYWQYYNHGYFSRTERDIHPYFTYRYVDNATKAEWYSGWTQFLPFLETTASLELGLNYSSANKDIIPSGEIPYVPRWRGSAYLLSRPFSWLDVSLWAELMGKRKTAIENETVNGFFSTWGTCRCKNSQSCRFLHKIRQYT